MTKINNTIEKLKRQILINESFKQGFISCGMKVVDILEIHWKKIPKEVIEDFYKMFNEVSK